MSEIVPEGWKVIEVQEAFILGRGRVISRPEIRDNMGVYPVYSSQSKDKGKMGSINTYDFEGEYITWTTDGAYAGTVFYRKGRFSCTNVCGTLKNKDTYAIDLGFVSRYLSTVAKNHVSYVGNPKLMNGVFAEIPFLLPPLPEQQKIASILTSVDEVIEKTQSQINKLQDLKKGTMQELLTRGIGHTEFKESPIGMIPKAWEVVSVESVLDNLIDYRGKSPPKESSGTPLLTAKNIRNGYLNPEPKEFISEEKYDEWMVKGIPAVGDVFFTTEAPLGNVALVPDYKFAIGQRVLAACPNRSILDSVYLLYALQGEVVSKQLFLDSTGSTVSGVKQSTFRKILLSLPTLVEQQRIAAILMSMDSNIVQKQRKLQQTQSLKKALMQNLLTGKVRVTVN